MLTEVHEFCKDTLHNSDTLHSPKFSTHESLSLYIKTCLDFKILLSNCTLRS